MQRLYLLDTMFFIHRAFYAVPELKAPCGSPINALYGVMGLLRTLWKTERFQHAAAVFESPGPTFRKQLDSDYKANRTAAPVDLKCQVAMVRVACECLGLRTIHVEGYEADDVMGTLAKKAIEAERLPLSPPPFGSATGHPAQTIVNKMVNTDAPSRRN